MKLLQLMPVIAPLFTQLLMVKVPPVVVSWPTKLHIPAQLEPDMSPLLVKFSTMMVPETELVGFDNGFGPIKPPLKFTPLAFIDSIDPVFIQFEIVVVPVYAKNASEPNNPPHF